VLAALSHPARVRLLNHLVEVGPSTATECATVAGVTPSACSYHLRHLARFGLVERTDPVDDSGGTDRRQRWWRAASTGLSMVPAPSQHDTATRTALTGLLAEQVAMQADLARDFLAGALELDEDWQDAAEFSSYGLLVDPDELRRLIEQIDAVVRPFLAVTRPAAPAGARVAHLTMQAFPRPAPPS